MLSDFANWLWEAILFVPKLLFSLLVDFVLWIWSFVFSFAEPFISSWHQYAGPVFSGASGYFLDVAQAGTGISMILTAYLVRFVIRRLPVVG